MISHITTLANGIIGVSVLAMPFCFKECGLILATLILLLSSALSRLACHFLIKSAVMCRRKNFEFLAFHAFGPMGKFLAELCIIGFLVGTCIAYFVVVGDLGPQIIGEFINKEPADIRTSLLVTTAIFIVLPLGLLRNISSLASVSTASIAFYVCLVFKVIGESTHQIFSGDWIDKIHYWRPAGVLQCLPIFALALFCQTQLFEIYEAMPNATLEKMNEVVRGALNICTVVYVFVGLFGYIGFCTQPFTGNILMSFEPSVTSEIIKIGFVLSVAFSFPLVIFPCRASLNSLLFRRGYMHLETSTSYISETRFRCLTTFIVVISMIIGILIPNIEFVLGIVGSTIGVLICLIFPATFFISISTKNTNERLLAQILVIIGMWIMILGTYANLYALEQSSNVRVSPVTPKLTSQMINNIPAALIHDEIFAEQNQIKEPDSLINVKDDVEKIQPKVPDKPPDSENIRREPPVPVELDSKVGISKGKKQSIDSIVTISPKVQEIVNKIDMDEQLIDEAKKAFNTLKKTKKLNDEALRPPINLVPDKKEDKETHEENKVPVEEHKKDSSPEKNNLIAGDAIKKEEKEMAAEKEISNTNQVKRLEQLEKKMEAMMEEQKELLKDIEHNKKELQLDVEEKKKGNLESNKVDDKKEKLVQEEKENKKIADLPPPQPIIEETIAVNKKPLSDLKESPNVESIKINESNDSNKEQGNKQNERIDNKGGSDVKLLINNLDQEPVDLIKKSEDPIINILTKQSNKISNEGQAPDIPKDVQSPVKQVLNANDVKDKKYSIPFVLKVNSQNNQVPKSEHLPTNQSNADISPVQKSNLENHQREKRMTDEKELGDVKINLKEDIVIDEKNLEATEKQTVTNEKESCPKEKNVAENLDENNNDTWNKLINDDALNGLIKTNSLLSGEEAIKAISIDPDLNVVGNVVKIKTRDLKSVDLHDKDEN